ncbi:Gfo/Idh/MocA family protein [Paenibacillus thalictri]|uniref:Gfo/Idh/MocA family oxidoreductase n=1 Tax=Paenibacillus thalictri TaxID=2527873 RepID=A0A4Q9DE11_9BACL|nr:Gfo/Idh/MocA family oxidoreductase [Paenibacillus thalictri]TBL69704.1 Gfo/Idh/MocA family oxidoreductase [Paenibacillus thalictri]
MIKVAVIGTGVIAKAHLEAYVNSFKGRCEVVALIDIYEDKAKQLKEQYQLDCRIVGDYHELLDSTELDLISVCTPPYTHSQIAVDFLRAGKHVLVEKPMASSLEECDLMLQAAAESGSILSIVGQNRFRDPVMKLKKLLDSGLTGKVVHAQVDSHWWRGHCYYDLWWRGTWEKEGGGCTLNHAVHHIDMLQWMMGMPAKVTAVMSNTSHDNAEVEDLSVAVLSYGNGSLAQITSSVVHHGEEQQVVFQTEKARISAPWKVYASVSKENGFPVRNEALENELEERYRTIPDLLYTGHAGQIDNVLSAIEDGSAQVLIDGQEGRKTLELITAIYEAASTGRSVVLPLTKESPFYSRDGLLANAPHFYEKTSSLVSFTNNEITLGSDYGKG